MVSFGNVGAASVVTIIIKGVDDFSGTFKKADKGMGSLKTSSINLTKGLLTVGGAAVAASAGIAKLAVDAGKGVGIGRTFNNMFGEEAPKALDALREATRGTVSDIDLMTQANQALLLGIDPEALPEMFKGAFAAAQATGRPVADAITDITVGIGRQSRLILDNLGIIVKAGDANEKFAASLGKTVSELTEQEKRAAFTSATMEALADNMERIGPIQDNAGLATQRASAEFENMKQTVGERFGPIVASAISGLVPIIETFADVFLTQVVPAIEFAFQAFEDLMGSFGGSEDAMTKVISAIGFIAEGLFTFIGLIFKGIQTVGEFGKLLKDLSNIALQNLNARFNKFRITLQTVGLGFKLLKNTALLAFEFLKLAAAKVANKVSEIFATMVNNVIRAINRMIQAFNRIASRLGFRGIKELAEFNVGGFSIDTSAIEARIGTLTTTGTEIGREITVNIETLSGVDVEEMAEALRTKLADLVVT